jgi:hypothetical protein
MAEPTDEQPIEAEYTLESPAACPHFKHDLQRLLIVRLLRPKVNFTSALPRRGQVMLCPHCRTMVAGSIGGLI